MPELPEVETIRKALKKHLPGKRIKRILVRDPRLRWPVDEKKLQKLILDQRISTINRRAKYLIIKFEQDSTLIIHLGMSGRLLLLPNQSEEFAKHDHVIFYFDNETELRFQDPRRFGMIEAVPPGALKLYPRFTKLGFEPLSKRTTSEKLFEKARNLKKPIKNLLMDAHFIVGVGNIYANEALFHAGIHPEKASNRLSSSDWQLLLFQLQRVLRKAVRKGGTTLNDFVNSNGEMGYFQLSLAVYGKEGERCSKCRSNIERVVLTGRSTFFCPNCQAI